MTSRLLSCLALLNLFATGPLVAKCSIEDETLDRLSAKLEVELPEMLEKSGTPGAGVAVLRGGKTVYSRGFGFADIDKKRPVTPETVFNIGSVSKTIAAWGFMKLVQEGEIDLDDPILERLTLWELPKSEFDQSEVTLRRLLSHTAGLSLHGYPGFERDESLPSTEESLAGETNGSGAVELIMKPGTQWKYSGGGYTISQLFLEEITGELFDDWMRREVLERLGMMSSDYVWSEKIDALAAIPYDGKTRATSGPAFAAKAAASLQTSVLDLARFAEASLPAFQDQPSFLTAETIASMQKPQPASPEYGLGYTVERIGPLTFVGHSGANRGWMSLLEVAQESGDGIILLTNGSNGGIVCQEIRKLWREVLASNSGEKTDGD